MASERRYENRNWTVADVNGNLYETVKGGAYLATLMDIRRELQTLNALLGCTNFTGIPATLRGLRRDIKAKSKGAK
jgi:hypothetical protein